MTFNYEEVTSNIRRPIIPVLLKSKTAFIIYRALTDSGADHCVFSIGIAELLEIKLSSKNRIEVISVGKDKVEGFWEEVTMIISGKSYLTKVVFADISDFGHGILGAKGFFDHFDVSLKYNSQTIEIQPLKD